MKDQPTLEEVLEYAKAAVKSAINKNASSIPEEQKEEISQNALVRAWRAFENGLDPDQTWEAFISMHCKGAVKDYLKQGHGFIQHKSQRYKRDTFISQVDSFNKEKGRDSAVEEIIGIHGHFTECNNEKQKIKWDLVARMASVDHTIHLVAKVLLGFNIEEQTEVFGVSRERLSQRYNGFLSEMSSPESARDPWFNQALYAFGVSEDASDNGLGHDYSPIDLYSLRPVNKDKGVHKTAIAWVKELYPDLLAIKQANIKWDLVSRLARYDEQLHFVATILLGCSPAEICEYFDIGMNAARNKVHRFVEKLDSSAFYNDPWVNQVIYALGLGKVFGELGEPDSKFGLSFQPIDLIDFKTPRYKYDRGDQMSLLVIIPGHKLQDGTEIKKTRSLRRIPVNREVVEEGMQTDFLGRLALEEAHYLSVI